MVLSDCCQVEPGWGKWWLICCLPSSPSPQAEQPSTTRELNLGNFHLHDCITNLTITCSLQKLIYIWRRVLYQSRYTRINNWIGLMKKCLLVINGLIQSSQKHLFTIFISHDISRLNHAPPQGESTAMLRLSPLSTPLWAGPRPSFGTNERQIDALFTIGPHNKPSANETTAVPVCQGRGILKLYCAHCPVFYGAEHIKHK